MIVAVRVSLTAALCALGWLIIGSTAATAIGVVPDSSSVVSESAKIADAPAGVPAPARAPAQPVSAPVPDVPSAALRVPALPAQALPAPVVAAPALPAPIAAEVSKLDGGVPVVNDFLPPAQPASIIEPLIEAVEQVVMPVTGPVFRVLDPVRELVTVPLDIAAPIESSTEADEPVSAPVEDRPSSPNTVAPVSLNNAVATGQDVSSTPPADRSFRAPVTINSKAFVQLRERAVESPLVPNYSGSVAENSSIPDPDPHRPLPAPGTGSPGSGDRSAGSSVADFPFASIQSSFADAANGSGADLALPASPTFDPGSTPD